MYYAIGGLEIQLQSPMLIWRSLRLSCAICHQTIGALLLWHISSALDPVAYPAPITYSWSGALQPNGDADPWSVENKFFELFVTVDSESIDLHSHDSRIDLASFEASQVTFRLGEIPASSITFPFEPQLHFVDSPHADMLAISLSVEFMGVTEELRPAISLPNTTFQFSNLTERPPIFGQAIASSSNYGPIVSGSFYHWTPTRDPSAYAETIRFRASRRIARSTATCPSKSLWR
jgi:hypothetical protein